MITYTSESNATLPVGEYPAIITKAEVASVKGKEKLIVKFSVSLNGENVERTEFVLPQTWLPLFTDLLDAAGIKAESKGGEFNEENLIGCEGTLKIVETEGKGNNAGKMFLNAERFLVKK